MTNQNQSTRCCIAHSGHQCRTPNFIRELEEECMSGNGIVQPSKFSNTERDYMNWNGGSLPQLNKNWCDKWYIPLHIEHKEEQLSTHLNLCRTALPVCTEVPWISDLSVQFSIEGEAIYLSHHWRLTKIVYQWCIAPSTMSSAKVIGVKSDTDDEINQCWNSCFSCLQSATSFSQRHFKDKSWSCEKFSDWKPQFPVLEAALLQFNSNLCLEQKVFGLSTKELMLQFFQESMQMQWTKVDPSNQEWEYHPLHSKCNHLIQTCGGGYVLVLLPFFAQEHLRTLLGS